MAVSPFCMLKKCRNPDAVLVEQDRCQIPESCGCSCHEHDDDDDPKMDLEPFAHVHEMAHASREVSTESGSVFGVLAATPGTRPPTRDERAELRVPCEREGCEARLKPGPGVASHMRWHARQDELNARVEETGVVAVSPAGVSTVPVVPGTDSQPAPKHPVDIEVPAAFIPKPEPDPEEPDLTPVVYEEPESEPDVALWLDDSERALLQVLVDASSVYTEIGEVALAMLGVMIESARDDLTHSGAMEALRYIGGLTDEQKAALDALDEARR